MCGQKKPQNGSATVLSYVESDNTSSIKIICPIPTSSPILRITGINEEGINIIWDTVDQVTGVTITVRISYDFVSTYYCDSIYNCYYDCIYY